MYSKWFFPFIEAVKSAFAKYILHHHRGPRDQLEKYMKIANGVAEMHDSAAGKDKIGALFSFAGNILGMRGNGDRIDDYAFSYLLKRKRKPG